MRLLAICLLAFAASAGSVRAEDLFDFLFGPDPKPAPAMKAARPVAQPRVRASLRAAPARTGNGLSGGGSAYCVRSCDGYFFPASGSSRAARQQSCEYACPSAPMALYEGGVIDDARNDKGEKYSRLPTAFSFRDKAVAACVCNKPDTSQALFVRISRSDPTLRDGDVIMSDDGALVYRGSNFVRYEKAHVSSWERERLRALLERARSARSAPRADASVSHGVTQVRKDTPPPAPAPSDRRGWADGWR